MEGASRAGAVRATQFIPLSLRSVPARSMLVSFHKWGDRLGHVNNLLPSKPEDRPPGSVLRSTAQSQGRALTEGVRPWAEADGRGPGSSNHSTYAGTLSNHTWP